MSKNDIIEEEYKEWLNNPVTKKVRQYLRDYHSEIKSSWASGMFEDDKDAGFSARLNLRMLAEASVYERLADMQFGDIRDFYFEEGGKSDE